MGVAGGCAFDKGPQYVPWTTRWLLDIPLFWRISYIVSFPRSLRSRHLFTARGFCGPLRIALSIESMDVVEEVVLPRYKLWFERVPGEDKYHKPAALW